MGLASWSRTNQRFACLSCAALGWDAIRVMVQASSIVCLCAKKPTIEAFFNDKPGVAADLVLIAQDANLR